MDSKLVYFALAVLAFLLGRWFLQYFLRRQSTVDKSLAEKLKKANADPNLEIKKGIVLILISGGLAITDYFHGFDSIQNDLVLGGYFLRGAYVLGLVMGTYTLVVEYLKRKK